MVSAMLVCVVLLAALCGGAALYYYQKVAFYTTHFFEGTEINGVDVSGQTAEEVKRSITSKIDTFYLTVKERDGEEILSAEDVGWTYADDRTVEKLLDAQDAENWFRNISRIYTHTVPVEPTYDPEKAKQAVARLFAMQPENVTEPKDAELKTDGNGYFIEKEILGNKLDREKVEEAVLAALDAGETDCSLMEPDCYVYPAVRSDDENLVARMTAMNKYLDLKISYTFGENVETIGREVLMQHVKDDGDRITVETEWVKNLVYAWGQKYDTFGLARKFKTHDGNVVDLPAGGDYGWVLDKEKTVESVLKAIENFEDGAHEPVFKYRAMGWDNDDITGTYAEVDLTKQMLYVYQNGELKVETPVVTGKPEADRETMAGIYAIDAKKPNAILGRLDVQGYEQPVSFWLPFNEGQGLHDAPWRVEFGGTIYQTNGSHGCVNVPPDQMEKVYEILEIGHAVILY